MTIIKYCPKCAQKPYTDKLTLSECPVCGAELVTEYVANEVLRKRPVLQVAVSVPSDTSLPGPEDSAEVIVKDTDAVYDLQDRTPAVPPVYQNPAETHSTVPVIPGGTREHIVQTESSNTVGTSIRGKIANYSNTAMEGGQYRRLGITRIFDALVYGQRLEDLAHRFTVRVSCGRNAFGNEEFTDVPVNVHGTIAGGIRLDNNLEVEVCGKYRNGILMARQVQILTNGCRSRVSFQHSIRAIVTLITAVIMLGLILYTGVVSEIGFWETIYQFFLTWLVVFGVILIFSLLFWFTRAGMIARLASQNQNRIPWGTYLIISFIITFIIFQFL